MSQNTALSDTIYDVANLFSQGEFKRARDLFAKRINKISDHDQEVITACAFILRDHPEHPNSYLTALWNQYDGDEEAQAIIAACSPKPEPAENRLAATDPATHADELRAYCAHIRETYADAVGRLYNLYYKTTDQADKDTIKAWMLANIPEEERQVNTRRTAPNPNHRPTTRGRYVTTNNTPTDHRERPQQITGDRRDPAEEILIKTGRTCVACCTERSKADRRELDGLCGQCREGNIPGLPELPVALAQQFAEVKAAARQMIAEAEEARRAAQEANQRAEAAKEQARQVAQAIAVDRTVATCAYTQEHYPQPRPLLLKIWQTANPAEREAIKAWAKPAEATSEPKAEPAEEQPAEATSEPKAEPAKEQPAEATSEPKAEPAKRTPAKRTPAKRTTAKRTPAKAAATDQCQQCSATRSVMPVNAPNGATVRLCLDCREIERDIDEAIRTSTSTTAEANR